MSQEIKSLFPKQIRGGFEVQSGVKAGPSIKKKATK